MKASNKIKRNPNKKYSRAFSNHTNGNVIKHQKFQSLYIISPPLFQN